MVILVLYLLGFQESERSAVLAQLDQLVGQEWIAEFPGGEMIDHQHFEWQYDGKFLRSRHYVSKPDGQVLYQGEALFTWDEGKACLSWWYWNSGGSVIVGSTRLDQGRIVFTGTKMGQEDNPEVFGDWSIEAGKWTCTQYFSREGRWEKAFSLIFRPEG